MFAFLCPPFQAYRMPIRYVKYQQCDVPGCCETIPADEVSWRKWHGFYYQAQGSTKWAALCPRCARQMWRDVSKETRYLGWMYCSPSQEINILYQSTIFINVTVPYGALYIKSLGVIDVLWRFWLIEVPSHWSPVWMGTSVFGEVALSVFYCISGQ